MFGSQVISAGWEPSRRIFRRRALARRRRILFVVAAATGLVAWLTVFSSAQLPF